MIPEDIEVILDNIVASHEDVSLSKFDSGSNGSTVAILDILADGKTFKVELIIPYFFPSALPEARLVPESTTLNNFAHISRNGVICLFNSEDLLLNQDDPKGILEIYIKKLVRRFEGDLDKDINYQILDEFEAYFSQTTNNQKIYLIYEPGSTDYKLSLLKGNDQIGYIYKQLEDVISYNNKKENPKGQIINVVHAFLDSIKPSEIREVINFESLTCKVAKDFIENNLSQDQKKRITKAIGRRRRSKQFILLSLDRPSGGLIFLLLVFMGKGNSNPYFTPSNQTKLEIIKPIVVTKKHLLSRGGTDRYVSDKRIMIVGLGSVGSIVANNLLHSGYTNLTFVDNDNLLPENTFRHLLGRKYWFKNKANAMKLYFEELYPFIQIEIIANDVHNVPNIFSDFDLTILLTGDPNLELYYNDLYHKEKANNSLIIAWNEPLGIGGHSLLMINPITKGCYRCLFDPDSESYSNRAAFVAPGQVFGTKANSCGETYIEYGFSDSVKTAELVSRQVELVFSDKVVNNPLFSWKGDASQIVGRGFAVSPRFTANRETEVVLNSLYYRENCKVCNE